MIKLILFDFDGVIADSNSLHAEVTRNVLSGVGLTREIADEEIYALFGKEYSVVLKELMGPDYSDKLLFRALVLQQKMLHSDFFFNQMRLFKGVGEYLKSLRGRGFKLAVVTGNDSFFIDRAIRVLDLGDVFDLVLSSDDVARSKPAPDMVLKAVDVFGVGLDEVLFVGDARNDVLAAKSAGVKSVVVLSGILDDISARALKPDYILDDVFGLDAII